MFFCWWQQHFEFQLACVAVEGRSNVVLNMYAQLQISMLMRFLSLLHWVSKCTFTDGICQLLIQQFFRLFASFKTTKSHENYVFLYPFSSMVISAQNNDFFIYFILVNCMGWQVCGNQKIVTHVNLFTLWDAFANVQPHIIFY